MDDVDNCTEEANRGQQDTNGDGIGNQCDADINNDCFINYLDYMDFAVASSSVQGDSNYNSDVDIDSNTNISFLDMLEFSVNFLTEPGPSAAVCVPASPTNN